MAMRIMRTSIIAVLLLSPGHVFAQEDLSKIDTLESALTVASRAAELRIGQISVAPEVIQAVSSPLGEGDPVRWVQGLPGVSTGADGSTAFVVRGGNMGNNLISLDGIPIYGYSHLLGLTTVIPQGIIGEASLAKGGFAGGESNFTASHLRVSTRSPFSDGHRFQASVNSFLVGVNAEGPVAKDVSYMLSARVSPLTWEYRAVRNILPKLFGSLDNFHAQVADVYGKVQWRTGNKGLLEAWGLFSTDRYSFITKDNSNEMMGWQNLAGATRYRYDSARYSAEMSVSVGRFVNSQGQQKVYRGVSQDLSLLSELFETGVSAVVFHRLGDCFTLSEGLNVRYGLFAPGQIGNVSTQTHTLLGTIFVSGDYNNPSKVYLHAAIRGHCFANLSGGVFFSPDASLAAKWTVLPWLSLEATIDRMTQSYHTLEGLPVGWALDMMVPSGGKVSPETVLQSGAGMSLLFGNHSFSLGGFYKAMDNLVYYKYSQALFNGALASWEQDIDLGKGKSYGMELQYEYEGEAVSARIAYTLSRTMREGFPGVNEGNPFHARFDRRHMLNATAQWRGITATIIYQSGQWENASAETYIITIPGGQLTPKYYSGVNNFQMPAVFRIDLGYQFSFQTGPLSHSVSIGVCNVTNHFNPFMIYYNAETESWNELAMLPILPNFSWRVAFRPYKK